MNIEHYKFLAGAAEAVQSRNTEEMRIKGESLVWLAEQIEIENEREQDND